MSEKDFMNKVIKELKVLLEGECLCFRPDPRLVQGIPDLITVCKKGWFALEFKKSVKSTFRPNQLDFLDFCNTIGHGWVIYPENKEEVLNEIQQTYGTES